MMKSRTMHAILALALCLGLATSASAQGVIWDQTEGYESWSMGFFNVVGGSGPMGMAMYSCNDVTVPLSGWTISTVKVYFDALDQGWAGAISNATLFIEPKTGSLPTGDPTTGTSVAASCVLLPNGFLEVSATGLGVMLDPGDYWIGLTPDAPNADNIHVSVAAVGDDTPTYDANGFPAPMWGGWAPGLDGAMLIEGEGTVATDATTLDSVKASYR
jgi:hypothetical protein